MYKVKERSRNATMRPSPKLAGLTQHSQSLKQPQGPPTTTSSSASAGRAFPGGGGEGLGVPARRGTL